MPNGMFALRWPNILAVGVIILGWWFAATLAGQAWQMWGPNQGNPS